MVNYLIGFFVGGLVVGLGLWLWFGLVIGHIIEMHKKEMQNARIQAANNADNLAKIYSENVL